MSDINVKEGALVLRDARIVLLVSRYNSFVVEIDQSGTAFSMWDVEDDNPAVKIDAGAGKIGLAITLS